MIALHRRGAVALALAVLGVALVAAAWRWTPLSEYIEPSLIAGWIGAARHSALAPLLLIGLYLGASALMLPNTALNAATILGLGTTLGLPCALAGSMCAALTYYALGRRYGTRMLRRLAPERMKRLQQAMDNGSTLKVASVRMLPVAPFVVVNVVAGSIRVRALPFAAGTFLGLLPGNLLLTVFGHQLRSLLRSPGVREAAILGAIVVVALACGWWLHRRTLIG